MAIKFEEFDSHLNKIDSQTTSAINQMEMVVNATYDGYTAREINSSDLVDPYVLQNRFSPGDNYQGCEEVGAAGSTATIERIVLSGVWRPNSEG